MITQINWWDNSSQNLANPDPNVDVYWGWQSYEEMLFGAYMMRLVDTKELAPKKLLKPPMQK